MERLFTAALSAIAITSFASSAGALDEHTPNSNAQLLASQATVLETEAVSITSEDVLGTVSIDLDKIADALQPDRPGLDASIVDEFNANKPESSNGITYILE